MGSNFHISTNQHGWNLQCILWKRQEWKGNSDQFEEKQIKLYSNLKKLDFGASQQSPSGVFNLEKFSR